MSFETGKREKKSVGKNEEKNGAHFVAVADGVEVRGRDREEQAEEARHGVEGDHEDDADDVPLEQRLRVVPEVLDDLSWVFLEVGVEQEFFFECLLASKRKKKPSIFFSSSVFPSRPLSRLPPEFSPRSGETQTSPSLPTWWIEISTAVQVQMPATASRGLLEETSIIFDAFFWAVFLLLYSRSGRVFTCTRTGDEASGVRFVVG